MADDQYDFSSADAGASATFPMQCSALRKGGFVMIKVSDCKHHQEGSDLDFLLALFDFKCECCECSQVHIHLWFRILEYILACSGCHQSPELYCYG